MSSKGMRGGAPHAPRDVNVEILKALEDGELSTKALAAELGTSNQSMYSRCQRLENKGLLKSKLKHGHGPMWCVDENRIITRLEYDRCREEEHDLRPVAGVERFWSLSKR